MARPLRIEFPGALYHVTARGNARQAIFLDDDDRRLFLHRFGRVAQTHRWRCLAYCLMPNHYHLLVETPGADLSRGMQKLNATYSQGFNARHERVGHVLQGRFSAILVEREGHLREVARYVVLNPVRAEMVASPEAYPWSSLRAAIGLDPLPGWLDADALLVEFGAPSRYLEFVLAGIGAPAPWARVRGLLLGSDAFVARMAPRVEREGAAVAEVPKRVIRAPRQSLGALLPAAVRSDRAARDARIRELLSGAQFSAAEIGRHLGLHYSTISKIASASHPAGPSPVD
jgi:REP element-mobilizing transposase RayT